MKKVFLFFALMLAGLTAGAQDMTESGAYEKKVVVRYDSVSAQALYVRALEALSDWAGSQEKSKLGIDVQDKDNGLVVYKGQLYIGYYKINVFSGWNVLADFTMKIRCKDGRAQFTCTIPSMTFVNYPNASVSETAIMGNLIPEYKHKHWLKVKKAALQYAPAVPDIVDGIIKKLSDKIRTDGDDF